MTEQELLSKLHNPKESKRAFAFVVSQYSQQIYWQIRRMLTDHDDANDVLQNTFIKAYNNINSFRGDCRLSSWLFKIAYNESITFLNRKKPMLSLDSSINEDDENSNLSLASTLEADPYFNGDETEAMLWAAIDTLPNKQRAVFTMKYFDDMKYEEMSLITGTSVGALKASYHLAVQKITRFFNTHD